MKSLNCRSPDNIDWLSLPQRGGLDSSGPVALDGFIILSPSVRTPAVCNVTVRVAVCVSGVATCKQPRRTVPP